MLPAGSAPFGGWRHQRGTMGAGQWRQFDFMAAADRKPYNRASPGGKQANRPDGRWKCTPSAACGGVSPRESVSRDFQVAVAPLQITFACHPGGGRFALHSASGLISISRHSAAKTSPSGGSGAQHQKGCISTRRRRGCMVFAASGSAAAVRRHIKLIA